MTDCLKYNEEAWTVTHFIQMGNLCNRTYHSLTDKWQNQDKHLARSYIYFTIQCIMQILVMQFVDGKSKLVAYLFFSRLEHYNGLEVNSYSKIYESA